MCFKCEHFTLGIRESLRACKIRGEQRGLGCWTMLWFQITASSNGYAEVKQPCKKPCWSLPCDNSPLLNPAIVVRHRAHLPAVASPVCRLTPTAPQQHTPRVRREAPPPAQLAPFGWNILTLSKMLKPELIMWRMATVLFSQKKSNSECAFFYIFLNTSCFKIILVS